MTAYFLFDVTEFHYSERESWCVLCPVLFDFFVACIGIFDDELGMAYPGGKGRLWQQIAALMPPHKTYIETHLGGGSVLRNKFPASTNIGIDVDPDVVRNAQNWNVKNFKLIQGDAIEFLSSYEFNGSELVYCDPPYPRVVRGGRKYYRYEETDEHHVNLIKQVKKIGSPVIVSGCSGTIYETELSDWLMVDVANTTRSGKKWECLWLNYEPGPVRHDYTILGTNFRERERLRKRSERWVNRLEQMSEIERHVIVDAMLQSEAVMRAILIEIEKPGRGK